MSSDVHISFSTGGSAT